MLDELVKTALIGTTRTAARPPLPAGAVADALASLPATDAEARLLDAVAVVSRYQTCGRTPTAVAELPAPAPQEDRPACSAKAGDLLARTLATAATVRKVVLAEWLSAAARANRRVPPAMIPTLLDTAIDDANLRDVLVAAVGQRGAWLMRQNPKWAVGLTEHDDPATVWTTGKAAQRRDAIRRLRLTDPARAVELVKSTWAEDGADERTGFVEAMAVGLTAADEPFLESALDDRSKQVREAAVELLARLPASTFVRRMTERADAMLKPQGRKIAVDLPEEYDPAWARDGIGEKRADGLGQRQSWLRQAVAAVPPAHWSTAWAMDPAACVAAVPREFADVVLQAWDEAAARHPDVAWVVALTSAKVRHGRRAPRLELLDALPPGPQQAVVTDLLRATTGDVDDLMNLIHRTRFAFGPTAAEALFSRVDHHAAKAAAGRYDYTLGYLLEAVALRVPPAMVDGLVQRWSGDVWEPYRRWVEPCLATLGLRRDIQREFAS